MKIAIIVRRLNVRGGTQRYAVMLARALRARGHSVTLYTYVLNREACFEEALKDLQVVALHDEATGGAESPMKSRLRGIASLLREESRAGELASKIFADTDVLNPHDTEVFRVAYYFKRLTHRSPSVWTMNDMPTRYASYLRAREVNPSMKAGLIQRFSWFLYDTYVIQRFIRNQDAITVLDHRDALWTKRFFGKEASVIRTGVDAQNQSAILREVPKGRVILLTAGIFFPHRRFEDIIEAVSILRAEGHDVCLRIIGDEASDQAYAERVHARAREVGAVECVSFLGRVSEVELAREYGHAHCFVFAAHMQSWGIAVFEAMAAGLPAIVSRTSGASEVLTDGKNALLVSPKDPADIARAVRQLFNNPDFYKRLSIASREFVEGTITWEKTAVEMEKVFERTLQRSGVVVTGQNV